MILAYSDSRRLRRHFAKHKDAIGEVGLGLTWDMFRSKLADIRKACSAISRGEVRPGRISVAVAVLSIAGKIEGSLSVIMFERLVDDVLLRRIIALPV